MENAEMVSTTKQLIGDVLVHNAGGFMDPGSRSYTARIVELAQLGDGQRCAWSGGPYPCLADARAALEFYVTWFGYTVQPGSSPNFLILTAPAPKEASEPTRN